MIRLIMAVSCLLALLTAPSSGCDGSDCNAAARVKPTEIARFMREQAASTRGATLRPLTRQAKRLVAPDGPPRTTTLLVAARPKARQLALQRRNPSGSKAVKFHSRSVLLRKDKPHLVVSSFAAEEPSVEVVTKDELSAIDRVASLGSAPTPMDQTALDVVTHAFDEVDRGGSGSLTEDDLRAASERAQVKQTGFSWLQQMQQMWTTLSAPFGSAN